MVLFTFRFLLAPFLRIISSAFRVLHSHANTSHRLIALAMASATFTGHFVHAVPRQPRLLPRCMPPLCPLSSLYFGPLLFPFCIMLACSANENKKYVWELLFKSTRRLPTCRASLSGPLLLLYHLSSCRSPNNLYASVRAHFWPLKFLYIVVVAITTKSPSRSASHRFILAPRPLRFASFSSLPHLVLVISALRSAFFPLNIV